MAVDESCSKLIIKSLKIFIAIKQRGIVRIVANFRFVNNKK